jgi:hypothetical protein
MSRQAITEEVCDGCGKIVNIDIHPRVIITDSNAAGQLEFCDYLCLGKYATDQHVTYSKIREDHMRATVDQLNATLLRAYAIEHQSAAGEPGDYATVASVPLHPLVELQQDDGGVPFVRLKVTQ